MTKRLRLALIVLGLAAAGIAAAFPPAATSADRMLVGFQDDPAFRWLDTRTTNLTSASQTHASIIRTTVYWNRIAPTRPAQATNPFDPAYQFDDLDEFVRNATFDGMTVMMSIWGTPSWANGNKGPNYAPTRMSDLQSFARALASRYSGRNPGYPFVGYYSIWNEPNLNQFLAPTYKNGKPYSPTIYASLARAAYAGIKSGNSKALVGIGETSPRGRSTPLGSSSTQDTLAPALFAQGVARARPKVKFDAWAHHPYSDLGQSPTQKVRYPNVNLPQMPQFEKDLDRWFGRKNTPVWITEYGFQTKPGQPKGVTPATQATYLKQAIGIARKDKHVQMFIWFIFRDAPVSPWHSGLETETAARKPSFGAFSSVAKPLDVRNPVLVMRVGASNPKVRIPVWELLARDGAGARLGATISVTYKAKTIAVKQPTATIGIDGYVTFTLPITKAKPSGLYRAFVTMNDENGNTLKSTVTVLSS
jgi:hypothetical protein